MRSAGAPPPVHSPSVQERRQQEMRRDPEVVRKLRRLQQAGLINMEFRP